MKKADKASILSTFVVCYLFWMLVTGQLVSVFSGRISLEIIVVGIIVSVLVAAFSARFFIHGEAGYLLKKGRLLQLLKYCCVTFQIELVKANLDVAKKALSPKLDIRPGIVKIPSELKSEYGQAMLANSITLTPGTITMDLAEDTEDNNRLYYYIHWLKVETEDPEAAGETIKGTMERAIRRIWE